MRYFIKTLAICILFLSSAALAQNTPLNSQSESKVNPQENPQISTKDTLSQPPKIFSSINPIHQIAKFISGDDKSNSLLINPRASEYGYMIRPSDIGNLSKADVIFYISDNLENTLPKAFARIKTKPKIVQLIKSKNIKILTFQSRFDEDNTDTHIWLSPENAVGIATEITDTLSNLYPAGANTYRKNLEQFKVDVRNMDEKNKLELYKVRPKSFLIDLNSTAYFENYYNMPAAGVIRYTRDQESTLKEIDKINDLIKREKVVCVLGSYQERNGLVVQVASNNKAKFALIDIMGSEVNYNQNGYTKMMSALVGDLVKCVSK